MIRMSRCRSMAQLTTRPLRGRVWSAGRGCARGLPLVLALLVALVAGPLWGGEPTPTETPPGAPLEITVPEEITPAPATETWPPALGDAAPSDLAASPLPEPWFGFGAAPPGRHRGRGQPLERTSWRNRPVSVGAFLGGIGNAPLIEDRVEQSDSVFGGVRLGYDWNHYWGSELRYGYTEADLFTPAGTAIEGTTHNWFLDVNAQWYFWGDSRWRPYVAVGAGIATFDYADETGQAIDETTFQVPYGGGVKYLFDRSFALRLDVTDNWAFGSDRTSPMHNVSYTLGLEWRFGGSTSKRYFPY